MCVRNTLIDVAGPGFRLISHGGVKEFTSLSRSYKLFLPVDSKCKIDLFMHGRLEAMLDEC